MRVFSVGHSNLRAAELIELLRGAAITAVADVRRQPGSRRFPWFSRAALAASLQEAGITYLWLGEGLGGRREPVLPEARSANRALRDPALRAFADAQGAPDFERDLAALLSQAARGPTAVMCAEGEWRACHRRILADVLAARGCEVVHLRRGAMPEPHAVSPATRIDGERVSYPSLL